MTDERMADLAEKWALLCPVLSVLEEIERVPADERAAALDGICAHLEAEEVAALRGKLDERAAELAKTETDR